jgi:hypothetical protein
MLNNLLTLWLVFNLDKDKLYQVTNLPSLKQYKFVACTRFQLVIWGRRSLGIAYLYILNQTTTMKTITFTTFQLIALDLALHLAIDDAEKLRKTSPDRADGEIANYRELLNLIKVA